MVTRNAHSPRREGEKKPRQGTERAPTNKIEPRIAKNTLQSKPFEPNESNKEARRSSSSRTEATEQEQSRTGKYGGSAAADWAGGHEDG